MLIFPKMANVLCFMQLTFIGYDTFFIIAVSIGVKVIDERTSNYSKGMIKCLKQRRL